jgi:chromosome partitioning protein
MKKFAAASQKGGVGKTNTNCHFSHYLADFGNPTLIVNGDEQEDTNDTMAAYELPGIRTHDLFGSEPLSLPPTLGKLSLIASDRDRLRELEESPMDDIELVINLRARLQELAPHFRYAVFDTAGANSRIANAFLIASDFVTVPTKIDEHSIREAIETIGRVGGIRSHPDPRIRNAELTFLGLLVNEYDPRQPFQVTQYNKLQEQFSHLTVPYPITDRQAYREAASARIPVWRLRAENGNHIKTAAREAGKEIIAVFGYFKGHMDALEVVV